MPTSLGVNFGREFGGGEAETVGKQGRKICRKKIAIKIR